MSHTAQPITLEMVRSVNARNGSFYSDSFIHSLRQRYANGETVPALALELNMNRETIYSYVDDLMEIVGKRPTDPRKSVIDRADLIEKLARRMTNAKIAKPYGMTRQSVTMYLRRNPLTEAEVAYINTKLASL